MSDTHIADILTLDVEFALYRYGHLYVVQKNYVTVIDPEQNSLLFELEFEPILYSTYGGHVCLYHPHQGIVSFSGKVKVEDHHGPGVYTAPFGQPARNNQYLSLTPLPAMGPEIYGLPIDTSRGPQFRTPLIDREWKDWPTGVLFEPGRLLAFFKTSDQFGFSNGTWGKLLYAEPPGCTVPYAYPEQGLLGAGTRDGYVFSPDNGLSYQYRKLGGFGVLTRTAIVRAVASTGKVELVTGRWT